MTPSSRFFPFTFLVLFLAVSVTAAWLGRRLARRHTETARGPKTSDQPGLQQSSDRPLEDPSEDRLGYATFAQHLAESFAALMPRDGLVVAIYGPWGSGKTTLLNFIKFFLRKLPPSPFVEFNFNPWWFPRDEDLVHHFFAEFRAVIASRRVRAEQLSNRLSALADVVASSPAPGRPIWEALSKLFRREKKDVESLKKEISEELRQRGQKILVTIDDIDRLSSEDIRQLFRLIKGVADFPNVLYLVAFDRDVVVKALAETEGAPGDEYLEKIVQVPFHLPAPDIQGLRMTLFEKLDQILGPEPEHFDQGRWVKVFQDGVAHFVQSPRDVVRLVNALTVTYPAVKDEVNPVDFIAVETLRVFAPVAYEVIRGNSQRFAGASDTRFSFPRDDTEGDRGFHEGWLTQINESDREAVKALNERLFPRFAAAFGGSNYGADWEGTWRRELRVCSTDRFPVYFRLGVPEGSISNAEMNALLADAANQDAFARTLVTLAEKKMRDETSRARDFLERLEDYTSDIPLESAKAMIRVFFDVGDKLLLPTDERRGFLEFGNDVRMGRVIWQLIKRFQEDDRFQLFRDAMTDGRAVALVTHEITTLGQQHGKYSGTERDMDEQLVTREHLEELERIGLDKIRQAAAQTRLLSTPDLPHILYRWKDWGSESEVQNWVREVAGDHDSLLRLLKSFHKTSYSYSEATPQGVPHHRLDPDWLRPFIDPDALINRVREMASEPSLSEEDRSILDRFILEFEMRQRGENPDRW